MFRTDAGINKSCPSVSIIVPVYNVAPYLQKCLDSILRQTYTNLEILVIDDGSTDESSSICDEYAELDNRVVVVHKENGGLSDARNYGLDIATGDFIGFVDSDDWIESDMFEYLLDGCIGYNSDISYCEVYEARDFTINYKLRKSDTVYTAENALNELFFDRLENYACNKLFRADLWESIRFPVGHNFEDITTIYKTIERSKSVAILKEPKYYYRIRSDSISGTKTYEFRKHIYDAIIMRYDDVAPRYPQFRPQLFRRVRNWYIHQLCILFRDTPENYYTNMDLLNTLAPFVGRVKDDIFADLNLERIEINKINAFAKGTVEGCAESLSFHQKLKRRQKLRDECCKRINQLGK